MVKVRGVDAAPVLPAASVAVAVMLINPGARAPEGVKLQAPGMVLDAVVVPSSVLPL